MNSNNNDETAGFDWDAAAAQLTTAEVVASEVDLDGPPVLVDSREAQADPKVSLAGLAAAERRPIVPTWAQSKASLLIEAKRVVDLGLHTAGFHGLRLPVYAAKLAFRAPIGMARATGGVYRWVSDAEARPVRAFTIERKDYEEYRKLVNIRDRHVRFRGLVVAAGLTGSVIGATVLWVIGGPALWAAMAAATVGFGIAGRRADKPLLGTAVVKSSIRPLTSDVVIRGLSVLGITGINQAIAKTKNAINFAAPITRDGPGWRAEVDLPWGVTAAEVMDKRDKLASGLGRPLGCVWPEGRAEVTPGRLVVWVGDQDMATTKPKNWPLQKSGTVDLFKAFPFGNDPRGNWIDLDMMYTNILIGSIPGMGKTFSMRVPLLGAALDPRAELWVYELKGTGDLEPLRHVAARYASGADDPEIEQALQALRDLRAECSRRAKVIKSLPKDVCPENKVTPELASKKSLGLHPLVLAIDECQELFSHKEYGTEAGELAEKCIKLGRALGIIVILATQRPDKDSLPTGVSANVGTRFCLRVMDDRVNNMILGSGMYAAGVRATMFTASEKGIGYLVGQSDEAQIVKTVYIDGPTAEAISLRARAIRQAAGRLTGYAAGQMLATAEKPRFDLLADILAVFGTKEKTEWNSVLVDRLVEFRTDTYGRWADLDEADKTAALTADLKNIKAEHIVVSVGRRIDGKAVTRRGLNRDTLQEIITLRDGKSGGN